MTFIYKSKVDIYGGMLIGMELKSGMQFILKSGEEFKLEEGLIIDTYVLSNGRLYLQVNEEQLIRFFERVDT